MHVVEYFDVIRIVILFLELRDFLGHKIDVTPAVIHDAGLDPTHESILDSRKTLI